MQVNVLTAPDVSALDYLIYPEQNHMNQRFFYNQVNQMSNALTDVGRQFMEASKEIYNRINDSNTVRMAKAAVRVAKGMLHPNAVYPIYTLDDIQGAQPVMQRYIMACPEVRELYQNQTCDGYSNTYVDMHPGDIQQTHYDYRRVMTGLPIEKVEGTETETYFRYYPDEAIDNERSLSSDEKFMIIDAWDIAKLFINEGKDPTSIFNNDI
jgi:hypothetical protein